MRALAAAMRRSAAATSGRRCSRVEGAPTGVTGASERPDVDARLKVEADSPTSTAMACSSKARSATACSYWACVAASWVWARPVSSPLAAPPAWRRLVKSRAWR